MKKFSFINKIKLNTKTGLIKQIALLSAILVVLVSIVFGWFSFGLEEADATDLSISVTAGDTMLISLDGGKHFRTDIDILKESDQQYIGAANKLFDIDGKYKLSMQDITSDGKDFFRPKFNEENGQQIPNTEENWDYATKNVSYISQEIVFRTSKKSDIFMGSDTKIITSCELEGKALTSDNPSEIGNKSSAGNFSNDCIVGALRISAIDNMNSYNPCRFVCIPRSDIELVRDGNNVTVNTGEAVSEETAIHTYYASSYQTDGAPVDSYDAITSFDGTQYVTTTSKQTTDESGKTVYEGTATINIWLEGCDPEVTRLLSGGKYKLTFHFVAQELE